MGARPQPGMPVHELGRVQAKTVLQADDVVRVEVEFDLPTAAIETLNIRMAGKLKAAVSDFLSLINHDSLSFRIHETQNKKS